MSGHSTSPLLEMGARYQQRRNSSTQLNMGSPSPDLNTPPRQHMFERTPSPSYYPKRGPSMGSPRLGGGRVASGGVRSFGSRDVRRYVGLALAIVSLYTIWSWTATPQEVSQSSVAGGRKISYGRESDVLGLKDDKLELAAGVVRPPPAPQQPKPAPVEQVEEQQQQQSPAAFKETTKKNRGLLDINIVSTAWDATRPELPKLKPATSSLSTEEVDEQFCPERRGEPCAFLVPAWLGEQETKAQMHLYQLGLLALSLGRTLVLPNVEKSRLSVCAPSPFEFYYDPDALTKLGVQTITYADFVDWSLKREKPAEAQVITVEDPSPKFAMGVVQVDVGQDPSMVPLKPTRKLCLTGQSLTGGTRARLDFSERSALLVRPQKKYQASTGKFGRLFIDTLKSDALLTATSRARQSSTNQPEVLAFNYELRYDILTASLASSYAPSLPQPAPFAHWAYSSAWTELADSIIESLSPLVAIHWRTEQLTPSHLAPCVDSLFHQLEDIQRKHPSVKNVYLATDYPLENGTPHSGTMANVLTEEHHAAFRRLLREFGERLPGLHLTTFAQEEQTIGLSPELQSTIRKGTLKLAAEKDPDWEPTLADLDPGLVGILDKTIASKAELFLAGSAGENKYSTVSCGKQSSFTGQVIDTRRQSRKEQGTLVPGADGKGKLWNDVFKWSTVSQNLSN